MADIEAEKGYLGCAVHDGSVLDAYPLPPEAMTVDYHRRLHARLLDLHRAGDPINPGTIGPDLALEAVSWDYFSSANAEFYHKKVVAAMSWKMARKAAYNFQQKIEQGGDLAGAIDELERGIGNLQVGESNYLRVGDVLHHAISTIESRVHTEGISGITTGFQTLDQMTQGWHPGQLILLGARPSVGKTALALNMISGALKRGSKVGLFELEMPNEQIIERLFAAEGRVDANRLRAGVLREEDMRQMMGVSTRLYESGLFLCDTPSLSFPALRAHARRMVYHDHVEAIYVDYMTLVVPADTSIPRHEQVSALSRGFKGLARDLGVPVIVLSQLRREADNRIPGLSDLRESGSLEQDADVVVFLHRQRGVNEVLGEDAELYIAKQRNGPVGKIDLVYQQKHVLFEEREKERT